MPISEEVIGIRGWKGVHLHDDVCTRTRFSSPRPVAFRYVYRSSCIGRFSSLDSRGVHRASNRWTIKMNERKRKKRERDGQRGLDER